MSGLLAAAVACEPARLSDLGTLVQLLWQFLSLSLFSLGGGNTLLAEYIIWRWPSFAGSLMPNLPIFMPWRRRHLAPAQCWWAC